MDGAAGLLPIDRAEMIAELRREIAMRREVYPRQVGKGRLTAEDADRRIAVLEAAIDVLEHSDPRRPPASAAPEVALVGELASRLTPAGLPLVEVGFAVDGGATIRTRLPRVDPMHPHSLRDARDRALDELRDAWRTVQRIQARQQREEAAHADAVGPDYPESEDESDG